MSARPWLWVGNVELLNCYYAHAEEDDRFQRRCYWQGLTLVHLSAQPQPFLTQIHTLNPPKYPLTPPKKQPSNNLYTHPLSYRKRLR